MYLFSPLRCYCISCKSQNALISNCVPLCINAYMAVHMAICRKCAVQYAIQHTGVISDLPTNMNWTFEGIDCWQKDFGLSWSLNHGHGTLFPHIYRIGKCRLANLLVTLTITFSNYCTIFDFICKMMYRQIITLKRFIRAWFSVSDTSTCIFMVKIANNH